MNINFKKTILAATFLVSVAGNVVTASETFTAIEEAQISVENQNVLLKSARALSGAARDAIKDTTRLAVLERSFVGAVTGHFNATITALVAAKTSLADLATARQAEADAKTAVEQLTTALDAANTAKGAAEDQVSTLKARIGTTSEGNNAATGLMLEIENLATALATATQAEADGEAAVKQLRTERDVATAKIKAARTISDAFDNIDLANMLDPKTNATQNPRLNQNLKDFAIALDGVANQDPLFVALGNALKACVNAH